MKKSLQVIISICQFFVLLVFLQVVRRKCFKIFINIQLWTKKLMRTIVIDFRSIRKNKNISCYIIVWIIMWIISNSLPSLLCCMFTLTIIISGQKSRICYQKSIPTFSIPLKSGTCGNVKYRLSQQFFDVG